MWFRDESCNMLQPAPERLAARGADTIRRLWRNPDVEQRQPR